MAGRIGEYEKGISSFAGSQPTSNMEVSSASWLYRGLETCDMYDNSDADPRSGSFESMIGLLVSYLVIGRPLSGHCESS